MKINFKSKIKDRPVVAALLGAVIIGLICLIVYVILFFKPYFREAPDAIISCENNKELILKPFEGEFNPNNYDYSNCTVYAEERNINPFLKTIGNYKITSVMVNNYLYDSESKRYEQYETNSYCLQDNGASLGLSSYSGFANTYVSEVTLISGNSGFAKYVVKIVEQGDYSLGILREYKGTTLENSEKLKEVVHKLYSGEFLENLEVENNKIKLTYKYKISNDAKNINSIALFALINNLEEIEFCHLNTDFATTEYNSTTKETIRNSFKMSESEIVTREQIQEENSLDLENFEAIVSL